MNLNAREKLVLVFVLVVVIWIAGIVTFIKPSIDDVKSAQNTLNDKIVELEEKKQRIEEDKDLKERIRAAYNKAVESGEIFYPRMIQHKAATEMQELLNVDDDDEQEIQNTSMSVSQMTSAGLSRYIFYPTVVKTTLDNIVDQVETPVEQEAIAPTTSILTAYTFSTSFTATKEDTITLMENLLNKEKKSMVITNFSVGDIGNNEDNTKWECSISFVMYMIPQLKDPDIVNQQIEEGKTIDAIEDVSE